MLLQCWSRGERPTLLCSQSCTENFRRRSVFVFLSELFSHQTYLLDRNGAVPHLTQHTAYLCIFLQRPQQSMMKFSWWDVVFPVWQCVLKHRWSVLYLLLSLSEDPRKPSSRVSDTHTLNNNKSTIIKYVEDTDLIPSPHMPLSFPGRKLWGALCPGPPQGCPLHPVLLHPAPEPGPGLRGEERGSVGQRGDQRHLQPGSLHAERTHADAAVTAGRVSIFRWASTHDQTCWRTESADLWHTLCRQDTAPQTDTNGINTKRLI